MKHHDNLQLHYGGCQAALINTDICSWPPFCKWCFQLHCPEWTTSYFEFMVVTLTPSPSSHKKSALVLVMVATELAINHYLNQWWSSSLTNICVARSQCVNLPFPKPNCWRTRLKMLFFNDKPFRLVLNTICRHRSGDSIWDDLCVS